jgi:hypothetical protein
MGFDAYEKKRSQYGSYNGNALLTTASTTLNLTAAAKANEQIFIQKLHVEVTTSSAGKTWSFKDTAGTPVNIVPNIATDSVAHFDFDFGPDGVPLTLNTELQLVISAAGAAGWVVWEAYRKRTVTGAP